MVRPRVARGFRRSVGLRSCINLSGLRLESVVLQATMEISTQYVLISGQTLERAIWVTRFRMLREDRSSMSYHPLADLDGNRIRYLGHRCLPCRCSSFVPLGPFLRPGLQLLQGAARRGCHGWPLSAATGRAWP